MQTTAQANLCNSPPERSSTLRSFRWVKSVRGIVFNVILFYLFRVKCALQIIQHLNISAESMTITRDFPIYFSNPNKDINLYELSSWPIKNIHKINTYQAADIQLLVSLFHLFGPK